MIETVLNLLKIHRKVIFGNPSVIVQDMLGIAPESLDAVDVVLPMLVGECLGVIEPMVLAESLQRIVAPEGVSVIHRSLPGMLPYVSHELISSYPFHHLRVDPAITLQQAEYNAFACRTSSTLALASAAEVGLINLDLSLELACFKLSDVVDGFPQFVVDSGNGLVVHAQVSGKPIGWLKLVEACEDADLLTEERKRLLSLAAMTLHISAPRLGELERTAEDTLPTP